MDTHLAWLFFAYGGDVAAVLCCTWAFWRGGLNERVGAAIVAISWISSAIVNFRSVHGPGPYFVIIDIVTLIALIWLAIWARKLWTICIAACMLNSVVSHFTQNLIHFGIYSYVTAIGFWGGWGLLICLAAGVWGHIRRAAPARD